MKTNIKNNQNGLTILEILVAIVAILSLIGAFLQPYFESQTYNKLTGAKTTWMDAAFVELRVQDATIKEDLNREEKP